MLKKTLWEAIKQQKKTVKDTNLLTMTMIIELTAFQNVMKNQQRLVICTNCDQSNPLPDLTEKVKCVNIDCNFFVVHCECKNVMFEAFEGVAFIDCSCGFKFLKQQQYGSKAFD